jgi:hypothetical protein
MSWIRIQTIANGVRLTKSEFDANCGYLLISAALRRSPRGRNVLRGHFFRRLA